MIETPADPGWIRPWIVCESSHRWQLAVRRFAPEMMPPPMTAAILPTEPSKCRALLSGLATGVILWEVRRESLAAACDHLARTANAAPRVLQLIAGYDLNDRERIAVSEFRCAAVIRNPEDLPRLARMIHDYFATSR